MSKQLLLDWLKKNPGWKSAVVFLSAILVMFDAGFSVAAIWAWLTPTSPAPALLLIVGGLFLTAGAVLYSAVPDSVRGILWIRLVHYIFVVFDCGTSFAFGIWSTVLRKKPDESIDMSSVFSLNLGFSNIVGTGVVTAGIAVLYAGCFLLGWIINDNRSAVEG